MSLSALFFKAFSESCGAAWCGALLWMSHVKLCFDVYIQSLHLELICVHVFSHLRYSDYWKSLNLKLDVGMTD